MPGWGDVYGGMIGSQQAYANLQATQQQIAGRALDMQLKQENLNQIQKYAGYNKDMAEAAAKLDQSASEIEKLRAGISIISSKDPVYAAELEKFASGLEESNDRHKKAMHEAKIASNDELADILEQGRTDRPAAIRMMKNFIDEYKGLKNPTEQQRLELSGMMSNLDQLEKAHVADPQGLSWEDDKINSDLRKQSLALSDNKRRLAEEKLMLKRKELQDKEAIAEQRHQEKLLVESRLAADRDARTLTKQQKESLTLANAIRSSKEKYEEEYRKISNDITRLEKEAPTIEKEEPGEYWGSTWTTKKIVPNPKIAAKEAQLSRLDYEHADDLHRLDPNTYTKPSEKDYGLEKDISKKEEKGTQDNPITVTSEAEADKYKGKWIILNGRKGLVK